MTIEIPKISLVVPIYNKEQMLYKCLDSLVNQTMQDIEIILINDGSTDNSEKVCLDYVAKYSNLVQYHAFDNGGVSKARNRGIDLAKGEYIGFIDSDDWVSLDFCEKMFFALSGKSKYCVACCDICINNVIYSGDISCFESFYNLDKVWRNSASNKLFGMDLLQDFNIRFIDGCHHSEDLAFVFCCLSVADFITSIKIGLYYYNINEFSVTQQPYIRDSLIDEIYSVIDNTSQFILDKKDYGRNKEAHYRIFIKQVLLLSLLPVIRNYLLDKPNQFIIQYKKFICKLTFFSNINNRSVSSFVRIKVYTILFVFSQFPKVIIQAKRLVRFLRNKRLSG